MPIDADTTVAHLRTVGCTVTTEGGSLTALPPTWRPDLTDPYDLVEEVARIVGYTERPLGAAGRAGRRRAHPGADGSAAGSASPSPEPGSSR